MPLQQIGLPSSVLTGRKEHDPYATLNDDVDSAGPSSTKGMQSTKTHGHGHGDMHVKRATSLDTASHFHRHFGAPPSDEAGSSAKGSSADEGGYLSKTLPQALGRFSGRWRSQWPRESDDKEEDAQGMATQSRHDDDGGDDGDVQHTSSDEYVSPSPVHSEMTLLKLSGMGGVTRSGSFSRLGQLQPRGGVAGTPRSQYRSSLSVSPEEQSDGSFDSPEQGLFRRPTLPFAWHDSMGMSEDAMALSKGVKRVSTHSSPRYECDLPSPSSRASTSSSLAAERSLSTLSRGHSTSSSSSTSANSSTRQRHSSQEAEQHSNPYHRRGSVPGVIEDAASEAATSVAADSETTLGRAAETEKEQSFGTGEDRAPLSFFDDDHGVDPASQVGPTVQRIRSIGRGNNARLASFSDGSGKQRESSHSPSKRRTSPQKNDVSPQKNVVSDAVETSEEDPPGDDTLTSAGPHTKVEQGDGSRDVLMASLQPSQSLNSDSFGKLTWLDAAQLPVSPEQEKNGFVLPAPRRHTGSYALRSKSALSSGAMGHFSGGGKGRAGMREAAAQSAASRPGLSFSSIVLKDSGKESREVNAGAYTAATTESQHATAQKEQDNAKGKHDAATVQDRKEDDVDSLPLFKDKEIAPAPDINSRRESGSSRGHTASRTTLKSRRSLGLPKLNDLANRADVGSALSNTAQQPSSPSLRSPFEPDVDSAVRPGLLRSATQAANMNVLRTPTTQEWSRYLSRKGLDPAVIVQQQAGLQKTHTRSRSNTVKSSASWKSDMDLLPPSALIEMPDSEGAILHTSPRRRDSGTESLSGMSQNHGDIRSPRLRAQPRLSALSAAKVDDLPLVPENDADDDRVQQGANQRHIGNILDRVALVNSRSIQDDDDDDSDTSDSSLDERMRALHEAISRPASRIGSPILTAKLAELRSSDALAPFDDQQEKIGPLHWPQRETAAAIMGYPLPPSGETRTIHDFEITGELGRGAYGLVKKGRVKDLRTGFGTGPEFCIKYIIKSRILADCWRRHKVLGPIPVEIHVLDQLRRLTHHIPLEPAPWSVEKLLGIKTTVGEGIFEVNESGAFSVGHPALCKMLDFFEDHEFYYLVMPCFGRGQDLFDYVESQPHGLSSLQVRNIFGQLADGLKFLHAHNIVHRDVKDENVILDGEGHIQLIDFGSAAHINARAPGSSARRLFDTFSGTLDYAAAEILRGEKYSGKEQDVWALGVVGYVLLCGDCPFWNGEEAMRGLGEGTRALTVLNDRCAPPAASYGKERDMQEHYSALDAYTDDDPFIGNAIARLKAAASKDGSSLHRSSVFDSASPHAEAIRRHRDLIGQSDGGGCLADAANLIANCLDLDPAARPTMDEILQHRFLAGARGWTGPTWWLRREKQGNDQGGAVSFQHEADAVDDLV